MSLTNEETIRGGLVYAQQISRSTLISKALVALDELHDERIEWEMDWETLRAEAKTLEAALEALYNWVYNGPGAVRNGASVGARILPPELGNLVRDALGRGAYGD